MSIIKIPAETPPEHELERELALIYCRVNTWCHPLTGELMSSAEREWFAKRSIATYQALASPGATQYVWMKRIPWTNEKP